MDPNQASGAFLPIWLLAPLCAALPAVWVGTHWFRPARLPWGSRRAFALRALAGSLTWLLLVQLAGRVLVLNSGWDGWVIAVLGGTGTEAVIALYAAERQTLPRRLGRWLLALRLAVLVLVLMVLLQPVLTYEAETRHERFVAVLLDDSASMQLIDPQYTASEKMQIARLYGLVAAGPPSAVEQAMRQLAGLRQEFEGHLGNLDAMPPTESEAAAVQLRRRRESLLTLIDKTKQVGETQGQKLVEELRNHPQADAKATLAFQQVRDRLAQFLGGEVEGAKKLLDSLPPAPPAAALEPLRAALRNVMQGLKQIEEQVRPLPALLDEASLASLFGETAAKVNRLAQEPRKAIARKVLLSEASGKPPLLDELGERRTVKLYRFASTPKSVDPAQWQLPSYKEEGADGGDSEAQEKAIEWRQATDLAAAMKQVQEEVPADRLAGVLILSDGRHNHGAPAEPIARRLGQQGVPICSVVLGSVSSRKSAAITDVHCPETVFLGDKVHMIARVRITGLRGQSLKITMVCDKKAVDEKTIDVAEDDFRTNVALSYAPKAAGLYRCQVELQRPADDILKSNKRVERHVTVSDERIKLLLVDDRPRWEFRYLRNLFAGRDKTVQLQYVLLTPDRIAGEAERPRVAASVTRPYGEFEATAVPKTPEEWLKFDLIVLGDLPPTALDETVVATLQKFVSRQGGALVVIAGPNYMPHAFTRSALAELLPATFEAGPESLLPGPEPAYRLALSPEGGTHVIMKQRANPTDSAAVWSSLPTMDWRHPVRQVKPGATVLAYAEPADPDEAARPDQPAAASRLSDTERLRLQRQNPLIVLQKYGAGSVLLLAFDRTWRLRYRVGDTNHHQFWSQVLRWATANRLAGGTAHVRLGTDRVRYQAGEPVLVRAQLLDEDAGPLLNERVRVRVSQDDQTILSKTLSFVPDSRGLYQGDLGALPKGGTYRVELEGSAVARLLALDKSPAAHVDFLVTGTERTSELVELSADWKLPAQLADLGGGKAVGPAAARELLDLFKTGSKDVREVKYIPLWDSWLPLCLILAAVSSEWILRKKVGLT